MSATYILAQIINSTYMKVVGKFQSNKPEAERKAFVVKFSVLPDFSKEEGYRYLELALYANYNYVSVYTRKSWDVKSHKEKNYKRGSEDWTLVMRHDSCWRDAVRDILKSPANRINMIEIDTPTELFYTLSDPSELCNIQ